ncbi:hypothetical protein KJ966_12325 [bacterium]|nr:hypothetical protein [bacterium]
MAFLYKTESDHNGIVIEYAESSWKRHQCFSIKGSSIWNPEDKFSAISWGGTEIQIDSSKQIKRLKSNNLTLGVIIQLPQREEKDGFIKVLTIENNLILLRSKQPIEDLSAGMLIDLSTTEKVGKNKFRIPSILQVSLPDIGENKIADKNRNLSLKMSANDQEQLEAFFSLFLKNLSQHNLFPISIVPLKIESVSSEIFYRRKIILPPAYNLKQTIESMTIPDAIQIAIV